LADAFQDDPIFSFSLSRALLCSATQRGSITVTFYARRTPSRLRIPGADIDPASDINPALVNTLKALDPNRPIREADIATKRQILPKTYSKWYKANVER